MWGAANEAHERGQEWWKAVRYYSTNQDDKMPPAGRYNAGQNVSVLGVFLEPLWRLLASGRRLYGSRSVIHGIFAP